MRGEYVKRCGVKKILIITLIIWTTIFGLSQKADVESKGAQDLIPREAMVVSSLGKIKTNPGLSFLMELEREKLMREESEVNKRAVGEMYQLDIIEVAAALFPLSAEGISHYIVVVEFPPDQPQKIEAFLKSLDTLLKKPGERMVKTTHLKHNIIYSHYRQTRDPEEISAYTRLGNRLILGTGVEVVKKAIDVAEGKSGSIVEDKEFIRMRTKAIEARDGFVYVNNKEARFVKTLREWEEDWHMTLFLSAESMVSIGLSFDLIDEARAKGKIVFRATKEEALPAIHDDARFLGEAIKRKFIAEKIDYTSKTTTKGNYVTLDFTIAGLKPVWAKVFGKEEALQPKEAPQAGKAPKREKALPEVAPEKREKTSYLPRLIVISMAIVTLLLLILPGFIKKHKTR